MSEFTPKKRRDFVFGSPAALKKPVPHILFLFTSNSEGATLALLRILLHFHLNVNPEFTWSFEFMEGKPIAGRKLQSSRHALNLSIDSITEFRRAFRSFKEQSWDTERFAEYIQQVIIQCQWNTGSVIPFQSPVKVAENVASIKIRNYLFVLGELPLSSHQKYLKSNTVDDFMVQLDALGSDLAKLISWEELARTRISLYWVSTKNQVDFSVEDNYLEWWFSNLFRYLGGGLIASQVLHSIKFKKYWKRLCVRNTDIQQLRQIINSDSPHEVIVSNPSFLGTRRYHEKITILNEIALPSDIEFKILEAELCSKSPIDIATLEFTIKGFGEESDFDQYEGSDFVITPIQHFIDYFGKQQRTVILSNKCDEEFVFVLKFSGIKGVADVKQVSSLQVNFESIFREIAVSKPDFNISIWLKSKRLPSYLENFLNDGIVNPRYTEKVENAFLGLWDPNDSMTPTDFSSSPLRRIEIVKEEPNADTFCDESFEQRVHLLQPYKTLDDLFEEFLNAYNAVIFGQFSHLDFIQKIIPEVYGGVIVVCEAEGADPIPKLLDFYIKKLIISSNEMNEKHRKLHDNLSFLLDNKDSNLPERFQILARKWFLKEKKLVSYKELMDDPWTVLKNSIRKLKIQEAYLQILVFFECLRIANDSGMKLTFKEIIKSKRKAKKRDMGLHLKQAVKFMTDKILIWSVDDENSAERLKEFSQTVIHQFYTESFPDLTRELAKKFEPHIEVVEIPFATPKKKKPKEAVRKAPIAEIKRAPTRIQQIRNRELSINPKKKRRTVPKSEKENNIPIPQIKIENVEAVIVPETPVKVRSEYPNSFLSTPIKSQKLIINGTPMENSIKREK